MTPAFPAATGGFAVRGVEQRLKAYYLVDSMEAAVRFRLPNLDEEQVKQLTSFAVSLGSRDAARFAELVLFSVIGMAQARNDLQNVVQRQMSDHPLSELLTRCASPPDADPEQLARNGAFHAMFAARLPAS